MDPLAHTLAGAALAETRLSDSTPLAAPALILGSNLPDIDAVTMLVDRDLALAVRRGWTHGVLAVAVLPVVLTLALLLLDRALARWRGQEPRARVGPLLGLSTLAVASHPALDWLNTYGVRFLMPFDNTWFYGDALFIVDPWVWLMLGAPVVLARSATLFGSARLDAVRTRNHLARRRVRRSSHRAQAHVVHRGGRDCLAAPLRVLATADRSARHPLHLGDGPLYCDHDHRVAARGVAGRQVAGRTRRRSGGGHGEPMCWATRCAATSWSLAARATVSWKSTGCRPSPFASTAPPVDRGDEGPIVQAGARRPSRPRAGRVEAFPGVPCRGNRGGLSRIDLRRPLRLAGRERIRHRSRGTGSRPARSCALNAYEPPRAGWGTHLNRPRPCAAGRDAKRLHRALPGHRAEDPPHVNVVPMRTTVTPDDGVAGFRKTQRRLQYNPFKQVPNDVLRRGTTPESQAPEPPAFRAAPFAADLSQASIRQGSTSSMVRLEAENFASAPFQPRPGFAVARPHQCGPALDRTVGKARVIGGRSAARIRAGLPSGLPGLLPQHNEPPAPARHIRGFWGTLPPPSIPDKVLCGKTLTELGEGENWSML